MRTSLLTTCFMPSTGLATSHYAAELLSATPPRAMLKESSEARQAAIFVISPCAHSIARNATPWRPPAAATAGYHAFDIDMRPRPCQPAFTHSRPASPRPAGGRRDAHAAGHDSFHAYYDHNYTRFQRSFQKSDDAAPPCQHERENR